MSRAWKNPNTSLPGWNYAFTSLATTSNKWRKKQLKRKKYLASRHGLNRDNQPNNQRFIPPKTHSTCSHCPPVLPECWKICTLTKPGKTLLSRWHRIHGSWKCTDADPEIEWFTRLNHPSLASSWIKANNFSVTWSQGQPSRSAKTSRDEHIPADSYQAQNASVPQGNNTDTSLNEPSPKSEVDEGLERNGVKSPRRLIARDVPGCQFAEVNR